MIYKKMVLISFVSFLSACQNNDSSDQNNQPDTPPKNEWVEPKILIIGHRGASALRPEHTLEAYQKAIDDGADFIEPDLVSTKDGVLIARHENDISTTSNVSVLNEFAQRKTTKIIDGQSFTGWFSEDFNYNEIRQSIKARERIPEIRPANVQYNDQFDIPTLDQIIQLAEQHYLKTGKIVGLYIETKHPTYFKNAGLPMEDQLIATLEKYQYTREVAPVYLQSFEVSNLKDIKQKLDQKKTLRHVKIIQLLDDPNTSPADFIEQGTKLTYLDLALPSGLKQIATYANGVGPSKSYIFNSTDASKTTTFIQDAHRLGLKVHPYTFRPENNFLVSELKCNNNLQERCESGTLTELQQFFEAGVDGVFTDDPALGRQALLQFQMTKAQ